MSNFVSKKMTIIFAALLIVGISIYVLLQTRSQQVIYNSTQHGFQVTLPKDFVQEVVSNPENVSFTRISYLPFSEVIPNIQLLVVEMQDTRSKEPKTLLALEDFITINDRAEFGTNPTYEYKVTNGIPTHMYCRDKAFRTCVTYALLPEKKVLKIFLNYPTQGEFSGKPDPAMEFAFKEISMSLQFIK